MTPTLMSPWFDPADQRHALDAAAVVEYRLGSTLEALDVLYECYHDLKHTQVMNRSIPGYQLALEHYLGEHTPQLETANMSLSLERLKEKIRTIVLAVMRQLARAVVSVIKFINQLFKHWGSLKRQVGKASNWAGEVIRRNDDRQFVDSAPEMDTVDFTPDEVAAVAYSQEGQVLAWRESEQSSSPRFINLKGAEIIPLRSDPKAPKNPYQGMKRPILTLPLGTLKVLCNGRNATAANALAVVQVMTTFHQSYLSSLTAGLTSALDYLNLIDRHHGEMDRLLRQVEDNDPAAESDIHTFIASLHGPLDGVSAVSREQGRLLSQMLPGGMRSGYDAPPSVYKDARLYDLTLEVDERQQYAGDGLVRLSNVRSLETLKSLLDQVGSTLDGEIEPRMEEILSRHSGVLKAVDDFSTRLAKLESSDGQRAFYDLWKYYLVNGPVGMATLNRLQRQVHYAFKVQSAFTEYLSAHLYAYEHPEPFLPQVDSSDKKRN